MIQLSVGMMLDADLKYKLNSTGDFFFGENYIKLDNTSMSALDAARTIVNGFGFSSHQDEHG